MGVTIDEVIHPAAIHFSVNGEIEIDQFRELGVWIHEYHHRFGYVRFMINLRDAEPTPGWLDLYHSIRALVFASGNTTKLAFVETPMEWRETLDDFCCRIASDAGSQIRVFLSYRDAEVWLS